MEKTVLAAASFYKKGCYFNDEFQKLPKNIQDEIRIMCTLTAEKIHGVFAMGFDEDGDIYFQTSGDEDDISFDDIGAGLEVSRIKIEKKELLQALTLWKEYAQ